MQSDLAHAARLSMLGEFTASIAHEVNQPLAAIATNGEAGLRWLGRQEPDIAEAQTLLGRIVGDARRAADIIARIRNMATKRTLARTGQAINPAIDETVLFVRHELKAHGVEMRLDLAPDLPNVLMDRVQIQQVLSNLIVNAVQAMVEHNTAQPRITITSDRKRTVMSACRSRTTVPVSPPTIAIGCSTASSRPNPAAWGSACRSAAPLSRRTVALIAAESRPGGGACFTITLPSMSVAAVAAG